MPVTVRKSKKRIIKNDAKHRKARLENKKKLKNPAVKKARQKAAKLWRKKNKVALRRKAALQ